MKAPEVQDLAALLVRLDELRQAERRAASARMVTVIGHLIGTPLNVIVGRAGLLRSNSSPEAINENVRRIEEQVERLSQRIRRLIDYFGLVEAPPSTFTVDELLADCLALYGPIAEHHGVQLELNPGELGALRIDARSPPLLLTTLLSLAIRTTSRGESVSLTVNEHAPKTLAFELRLLGLDAPPGRLDKLEPPEPGVRYDAGALETLWMCLGLAKRNGGGLEVVPAAAGPGSTIRFDCPHS